MAAVTLGYIYITPSVDNITSVLKESGRVDNLDDRFIIFIARLIFDWKHWDYGTNGAIRITERHLDFAMDFIKNQVDKYL